MREILHDEQGLTVAVAVDDGTLRVELQSTADGPDLSVDHEVVVVVDGQGRQVDVEGPHGAQATVVEQLPDEPQPMMVMVRVHEFFDGWELFAAE